MITRQVFGGKVYEGKLLVELVPSTSWGDNLRSRLPRKVWDRLRREQYAQANRTCEVCDNRVRRLECHERWHYNDQTFVQTLLGLEALCFQCHRVRHLGFAFTQGKQLDALIWLTVVNDWLPEDLREYVDGVFDEHAKRSQHPWTLDLSWLATVGVTPPTIAG